MGEFVSWPFSSGTDSGCSSWLPTVEPERGRVPKGQCLQIPPGMCGPTHSRGALRPQPPRKPPSFPRAPPIRSCHRSCQPSNFAVGCRQQRRVVSCHSELPRDTRDNEALFLSQVCRSPPSGPAPIASLSHPWSPLSLLLPPSQRVPFEVQITLRCSLLKSLP